LHINHVVELQISDSYTSILQHYHNGKLVKFQLIFLGMVRTVSDVK